MSTSWEESFELLKSAIIKLARLSNSAPAHVLTRTVPILTRLLGSSSSPSVQGASAYCLKCIAHQGDGDRMAILIGQYGAIPIALRLLQHSEGSFQRVLVKCLWSLVTFGKHNRVILVRNGGLEIIIRMLGSYTGRMRQYLLEILSALALLREVRRVIISLEGLRFLVQAVKFGGMASRERAAHAVGCLGVAKKARRVLVDLGAMHMLIELFREGDASTKLVAGNALGVISSHIHCIRPFAQAGAIPLYVELLRGHDPIGKEIAEDVFCVLAVAEVNAVAITEHLVEILRENDDVAKAAAADILWDLSSYHHSVSFIRNSGAIPILVQLLRIEAVNYSAGDRAALAEAGAIPVLIDLLGDESEELRENAAEALISFSEDPSQRSIMSEAFRVTSFQEMQNRLVQIRSSDEYMARSLRQMSMEQLLWDPDMV
ncbi:hypothetical protein AAG906_024654 [Vitis piasezkii]